MRHPRKVILHTPAGFSGRVEELAHEFIRDGVVFVACVGKDCEVVEDVVDWVAVEAGSPEKNFILTSCHPNKTLEEAIEFAESLSGKYRGAVRVVDA